MANMDCLADPSSIAVHGIHKQMASQLHQTIYNVTCGIMEQTGYSLFIEILWDSRWLVPDAVRTGTGVFAGFHFKLWDSTWMKKPDNNFTKQKMLNLAFGNEA